MEYDFKTQDYARLDPQGKPEPVYSSKHGDIIGLGYEAPWLWILTEGKMKDAKIVQVDWRTKTDVAVIDVATVSGVKLGRPKGLEAVGGELYVVDGDPPHKIFVLRSK